MRAIAALSTLVTFLARHGLVLDEPDDEKKDDEHQSPHNL
jgi:hypothetical protein